MSDHSQSSVDEPPRDKVLFDALVDNEKEYLKKILRSKLLREEIAQRNPCAIFFTWLIKQFRKVNKAAPPPALIYDLEFLEKAEKPGKLCETGGSPQKADEYFETIHNRGVQNYEEELDLLALASACQAYIRNHVEFFDSEIAARMNTLYREDATEEERKFFLDRAPFVMMNRTVFRLVKELLLKLDKNKDGVKLKKSVELWADMMIPEAVDRDSRRKVLKDLLAVEFDNVPLSFYE